MEDRFRTVGVVGLGTMGAGIAEVFGCSGLEVIASEVDGDALERGRATLTGSVDRAVRKGRLSPEGREELLGRVRFVVGLDELRGADLVVEAVPERLALKRRVFAELDRVCPAATVLATNTSSLSVTEIAATTGRPERVVGMHFFNPAPVLTLVEVVRTVVTADEVAAEVATLCDRLGKVGVTVRDRAGFIANRLLFGYLNRAVAMYEQGYAGREDLDAAMTRGAGLPMGPLTLMDLIGLDTCLEVLETVYHQGGHDRRHAPAPLLRQMVTAALLGRKAGAGFYTYETPGSPVVVADPQTPEPAATAAGRPVTTVAMVGSPDPASAAREAFAAELTAAGYEVVTATGPEGDGWRAATSADLVVVEPAGGQRAGTGGQEEGDRMGLLAALGRECRAGAVLAVVHSGPGRGAAGPAGGPAESSAAAPVTADAAATGRPADVVGLHLPAPPPEASMVEVVRTVRTAPEALATVRAVVAGLDRTPVVCPDRPGFLRDALLFPYLNDAVAMLEAGYASVDDIDRAMKRGCGLPAGPFEQLDTLGMDTAVQVLRAVHQAEPEPGLAPAPLLEQLVTAGVVGAGRGPGLRDRWGGSE